MKDVVSNNDDDEEEREREQERETNCHTHDSTLNESHYLHNKL